VSQRVTCWTPDGEPVVEFRQLYFPRGDVEGVVTTSVRTPLASLDRLAEFFERRLKLPSGPVMEDRLFAYFTALVQRGELGAGSRAARSPRDDAEVVVRWFAAAGAPYQVSGERKFSLLTGCRRQGNAHLELYLTVKTRTDVPTPGAPAVQLVGLSFTEHYDYVPQPGDAGREYGYHAALAYTPMEPLVAALEERLTPLRGGGSDVLGRVVTRSPELDERLVACFRGLVTEGKLNHELPSQANRNRVAAILSDLGEVTTDSSAWINSD
jgi:hypothetical protein